MLVENIIGNEKNINYLKGQITRDEVSHSYIFEGEEGIGKKSLAIYFSAMILCENRVEKPCGYCNSCLKIKSRNHPDLILREPTKSQYSAEDCAEIQEEIRKRPNESEKKIVILTEGDKLSVIFQNKFLKTLEEPPKSSIIIILTKNTNILLETTKSRCQIISLEKISKEVARTYFKNIYDSKSIDVILSFFNGNIGKGKKLIEDESLNIKRKHVSKLMEELIIFQDETKVFANIEYFLKNKEDYLEILDLLLIWHRDLLFLKKLFSKEFIINNDEIDNIERYKNIVSIDKIYENIKKIEETKINIKNNVNYQLSIESLLYFLLER